MCYRCPASHVVLANGVVDALGRRDDPYQGARMRPRPGAPEGTIVYDATLLSHPLPGDVLAEVPQSETGRRRPSSLAATRAPRLAQPPPLARRRLRHARPRVAQDQAAQVPRRFRGRDPRRLCRGTRQLRSSSIHRRASTTTTFPPPPRATWPTVCALSYTCSPATSPGPPSTTSAPSSTRCSPTISTGRPPDRRPAVVVLATGHKAKGLQWDCVYLLEPAQLPLDFVLRKDGWPARQERNLQFVCYTRSKSKLIFLRNCRSDDPFADWRAAFANGLFGGSDPHDPFEPSPHDRDDDPKRFGKITRGLNNDGNNNGILPTTTTTPKMATDSTLSTKLSPNSASTQLRPRPNNRRAAFRARIVLVHPDKQAGRPEADRLSERTPTPPPAAPGWLSTSSKPSRATCETRLDLSVRRACVTTVLRKKGRKEGRKGSPEGRGSPSIRAVASPLKIAAARPLFRASAPAVS